MSLTDPELAIAAARAGAAVVRAKYGESLARFDKSPNDFATDADVEAEHAILDVLRAARPDDAFVGEESGHSGTATAGRTWLIDPLCGTLNYAAQTGLVAVNVALRSGDEISAAASMDPFADEVFWTDTITARMRRADIDHVVRPSAESHLVDVNLDAPHPEGISRFAASLLADRAFAESFRPRVLSTTLALAWVATGRRAAYLTEGDLRDSVHFSAGIALCRAAGCVVTGLRGQPLHTGDGGLVAAADEETHAALVAIARAVS
ncbi:MAG: phosphatase [Marmoricola sp.]|nr:phosphatase [Marmoricola sp.]